MNHRFTFLCGPSPGYAIELYKELVASTLFPSCMNEGWNRPYVLCRLFVPELNSLHKAGVRDA